MTGTKKSAREVTVGDTSFPGKGSLFTRFHVEESGAGENGR